MDTADYNPHAQPIRRAVNSLHEANARTDLSELLVDYVPREGFSFINNYLERLQISWNTLVRYVEDLLEAYDPAEGVFRQETPPLPLAYPPVLRNMAQRMKRVVEGVGWLKRGLPRENIIEPQLGYALRQLVTTMQQNLGCSHGLVEVFEVDKTE
jgi:hypothetical protein